MTLQDFLNENVVIGQTREIALSDRFKDETGKPFLFKIRTLSKTEVAELRQLCSYEEKGVTKIDTDKYDIKVCIAATVYPSFKDAKSAEKVGVGTPEEYLQMVLKAGEIEVLSSQILDFSGYDKTFKELLKEAKN